MIATIKQYSHWLHTQWPSANIEKLPLVKDDGSCSLPGVYIVGDLSGVPLLKFSADTGAKAVQTLAHESSFSQRKTSSDVYDVIIIGAGVSGYSAALEAKKQGLKVLLLESSQAFSTIENFPKGKPIYTYPSEMTAAGELKFEPGINDKESLLASLKQQISDSDIPLKIVEAESIKRHKSHLSVKLNEADTLKAHRVIIAIGRSGNYRQLDNIKDQHNKVFNRLHDPKTFNGKDILVVGGGDSAVESALALAEAGAQVSLSYRQAQLSRPKPENIEKFDQACQQGHITPYFSSQVSNINDQQVELKLEQKNTKAQNLEINNDAVFALLGREAPLDFFRRSKIAINGESSLSGWILFALFFVFTIALYDWKNFGFLNQIWGLSEFPNNAPSLVAGLGDWWQQQVADRSTLIGTIAVSMKSRSFYYTLIYTSCIGFFGWQRVKRRNTPYVTVQTWSLFLVQFIPLFILPEVILPWLGYLGAFDTGFAKTAVDQLFPSYISAQELANHQWPEWGHPRAYWHAYGFILAWPLNVYNVFTPTPMTGWLIISAVQTFVLIPWLIYRFGKGAYCGWICSCGALAETLGDTQRHKMPKGDNWNKLNMLGQIVLAAAFVLLIIRIFGWVYPESWMNTSFNLLLKGENSDYKLVNPASWKWVVDVLFGGILGVGLYFKYSGRIWCRFACPLAALMHIYSRFSRFRIFAEKDKCISCNACSSVCHQGIDVMSFANKGEPMEDPQCVRCSACVQTCPTGVLSFGEIDKATGKQIKADKLAASPVQLIEVKNV